LKAKGRRHGALPGRQTPITHWFGDAQSAAVWQGNAHLLNCVLHRCRPQVASLWHGRARRPGVAIGLDAGEPAGAGAAAGIAAAVAGATATTGAWGA
jgi:hypothetical protein